MEYMNERYAELATALIPALDQVDARGGKRPETLARLWTGYSDARNYILLGDPAVRLPLAKAPDEVTEALPVITVSKTATTQASHTLASGSLAKPLAHLPGEAWRQTPAPVQAALVEAVDLIQKLKTQLDDWSKEISQ
jgi:hypothetical protein